MLASGRLEQSCVAFVGKVSMCESVVSVPDDIQSPGQHHFDLSAR